MIKKDKYGFYVFSLFLTMFLCLALTNASTSINNSHHTLSSQSYYSDSIPTSSSYQNVYSVEQNNPTQNTNLNSLKKTGSFNIFRIILFLALLIIAIILIMIIIRFLKKRSYPSMD